MSERWFRAWLRRLVWTVAVLSCLPSASFAQTSAAPVDVRSSTTTEGVASGTAYPAVPAVNPFALDRERLTHFVDTSRRKARAFRQWRGVSQILVGGIMTTAGSLLLRRDTGALPIILTAQGGAAVLGGLYSLALDRDPYEVLYRELVKKVVSGASDEEVVTSTRMEWARLAHKARSTRMVVGALSTVAGSIVIATAIGLAAPSSTTLHMTPHEQALVASLTATSGAALVASGLYSLLVRTPIEDGWASWGDATSSPTPTLQLGAAPVYGGGVMFSLGGSF